MMFPLMILFTVVCPLRQQTVVVLDSGAQQACSITKITNSEVLIDQSPKKIPLNRIEKITLQKPLIQNTKPTGVRVFAAGQTVLAPSQLELVQDTLQLTVARDQPAVLINRKALQSIRFTEGIDPPSWKAMMAKNKQSDGLIIQRGQRLDLISGVIKTVDSSHVEFETRGKIAKVELKKIAGLKFFQPPTSRGKVIFRVTDIFQNQYGGTRIATVGNHLTIHTDPDTSSNTPDIQIPMKMVAEIDFSAGKFVELPVLDPQSHTWEPFATGQIADNEIRDLLELTRQQKQVWIRNRSFNAPLMIEIPVRKTIENPAGRITYQRGIAILGGTRLVYEIPQKAKSFDADAGIQASRSGKGSVLLEILVDGKSVYKKRLTATDRNLTKIQIPVSGERITFAVDYGGDNEAGDVLVLGNPKFKTIQ